MYAHTITIDGGPDREVADVGDLKKFLEEFKRGSGSELFLNRDDGSWSCILTNGDRAFVALSIEIDRENYFAVDSDYIGSEFSIPFRLSNGQVDEHPRTSTVSVADALASLEDFVVSGTRSQRINWRSTEPVAHLRSTRNSLLRRLFSRWKRSGFRSPDG